jgi:hypothetical protein
VLVYTSTSTVYGGAGKLPAPELCPSLNVMDIYLEGVLGHVMVTSDAFEAAQTLRIVRVSDWEYGASGGLQTLSLKPLHGFLGSLPCFGHSVNW